jgi:hypothetical protein
MLRRSRADVCGWGAVVVCQDDYRAALEQQVGARRPPSDSGPSGTSLAMGAGSGRRDGRPPSMSKVCA